MLPICPRVHQTTFVRNWSSRSWCWKNIFFSKFICPQSSWWGPLLLNYYDVPQKASRKGFRVKKKKLLVVYHIHDIFSIHVRCTVLLNRIFYFLLLLLPVSFRALFAVVCILSCALLLSNVSFGIHCCSNVSCGIDCMPSMDVWLFWVCRRSRNREGWVLFFLLVRLTF